MRSLIIGLILVGLVLTFGFVSAHWLDGDAEVSSEACPLGDSGCPYAKQGCTTENNCGVSSCGATSGSSCGSGCGGR